MLKDYNRILSDFIKKQRDKAYIFLQKSYQLEKDDSDAVFQDSLIILWEKLKDVDEQGIINMTSTSTYFLAICKNKARELLRDSNKMIHAIDDDEQDFSRTTQYKQENINFLLTLDHESDIIRQEEEDRLHQLVKNLPEPCEGLLWGYYRDELSLKELAEKFDYKSEGTVKVTKHRCLQKLITKYKEK